MGPDLRWTTKSTTALICLSLVYCYLLIEKTTAQRSLQHLKRDLEYRLTLYRNQRKDLENIIASSIVSSLDQQTTISSSSNVRFSDLIIPHGSLLLDGHLARPTVKIMADKTQRYLTSKLNELNHIRSQLNSLRVLIRDPVTKFIYKDRQDVPQFQTNMSQLISGTIVFKQVQSAHLMESKFVRMRSVNYTDVDRVINDTYMKDPKFGLLDSENRLFFEGRKTFWNTVFSRPLKSGCCDRLRPLHTNRMMVRSLNQTVTAPVIIHSSYSGDAGPVAVIRQLESPRIYNRHLTFLPLNQSVRPGDVGLAPSIHWENDIQIQSLINVRYLDQPEILKTIIFANTLNVDEALLSNSFVDNRLVIGLPKSLNLDLSHENYLLKFTETKNHSLSIQQVASPLILGGYSNFLAGVDALRVNQIRDFKQFVQQSIVCIDRPAIIRGLVRFDALPILLNPPGPGPSRSLQNVLIMSIGVRGLEVGLVNGMRLPSDIVLLPFPGVKNLAVLQPNQTIFVNGHRHFVGTTVSQKNLQVKGLVDGLEMPSEVIPLHLNDIIHSNDQSNLWLMEGIVTQQLTTQSGQFDEIILRDVHQGDAQSLIMRSLLVQQPDGSQLIRAPLHVVNLKLVNQANLNNYGLLNGFRPQEVLELVRFQIDALFGRKVFLQPVEASDCVFSDINTIANWTNHLIRTDRKNTMQTIHTKLAFAGQSVNSSKQFEHSSMLNVDHLDIEFYPDNNPINYANNWNFCPELYIIAQALLRASTNSSGGHYRVLNQIRLMTPSNYESNRLVNNVSLHDIVTVDIPFRFSDTFVMVGKVEILGSIRANRIRSNYPFDIMDLVQFEKYRIPVMGSRAPIELDNLVLGGQSNQAAFVQARLLNGTPFSDFANSIMSLTRPQVIGSNLIFESPVDLQGIVKTESALNGIQRFRQFASRLKDAKYSFVNGLQCNSLVIV